MDGRLLVVCKDDQLLEVIDLASGVTVGRVTASGFTPHEVAATRDGTRAYLPIYGDTYLGEAGTDGRAVDVIDLISLRVEERIAIDVASRPHLPVVGGDGRLYVSTELDESISVFDLDSRARVARLPTGRAQSHMFALSPDGLSVYSANVDTGTVSFIDVVGGSLVGIVDVAEEINRISVTPDGRTAFCCDQRQSRLAVIDLDSSTVSWIDLPSRGFGSAVTPDGRSLVVALRWSSQIGVIDLTDFSLAAVVDVPARPQAVAVHPGGRYVYSACDSANAVVEVDLATAAVTRTFPVGRNPDGICWAAAPLEPR